MKKPDSKHPNLTAETKKFLEKLEAQKAPPLYTLSYEEARNVLLTAQSQSPLPAGLDCAIKDEVLEVGPTKHVDLRVYHPKNAKEKSPALIYYHGGGWVMGDKKTHERLVRELAVGAGITVFYVNYTPSPEAQYPVPVEQAYAGLEYVAANADKYNIDVDRIALCGDSVGGNMTAAVTIMAKERKGPKLKYQVLIYPVTSAGLDTESYSQFADGPWLTKKAMEWFWDTYAPKKEDRKQITASPLLAEPEQLKDLPPALVITGENDVLRDEGEQYAQKLMDAGVKTSCIRYNGTIHDFMMLDGISNSEPSKKATYQVIDILKRELFSK